MAHSPTFNLQELLFVLNPFIERHEEGSKEKEAFKLAQAALLYIRDHKHEEDFARYYGRFSDTSFTVEVAHEFATRAEADQWLASGQAQEDERVRIAGEGFMVVRVPGRLVFMVAPLPEELETEEWKEEPG